MENSILLTIKKLIGLDAMYTSFDTDLIVFINTAIKALIQIGVGTNPTFAITGPNETWSDFLTNECNLEDAKTYIYLKTRLLFDPPSSSTVIESYQKAAAECEWRISVAVEPNFVSTFETPAHATQEGG